MVKGLDVVAYQEALETIKDNDNLVVISDLGLSVKGTQIDTLTIEEKYEGAGEKICFYASNPTNTDDDWEELILSVEEINDVLADFNALF